MRGQETGQFSSFDGLDNRREVMILFMRLGHNLHKKLAVEKRAKWLQGLIPHSVGALAPAPLIVQPCDPIGAYGLFVAICGVLDVPIEKAAKMLDDEVRREKAWA
jgi:hypothetical protein